MPAPKSPALDDEIRALYQGPLAEFTTARQALAKRLHREADPRSSEVQKLRKPTPSAWAVARLFAAEARAMAALLAVGKEARATPRAGADGASVRQALERIRAETERLLGAATELLTAAAAPPSAAVLERVRQNLEALALDPANAGLAARGWLDGDLDPPGFEVMAALQIAAEEGRGGGPAGAGSGSRSPTSSRVARPGPAQAKRAERQRRERVEAARRELARAEKRAAELRETADESAHAAERAAFAAAKAARQADQARNAAQETKRAAESAAAEVAQARETLRKAERGD